jgi:hypothetical protein
MEEIQRKRFVKVAIVSDSDEYNAGRAKTVTKALETMDKRYGIKLGGYSFMKVSPAGAWTPKQMTKAMFRQICPMGPKQADLFVVFTSKPMPMDIGMVLFGLPSPMGYSEGYFGRFAFIRVNSSLVLAHELEHLFGAKDLATPNKNLETILANKWRRFDGWYILNEGL